MTRYEKVAGTPEKFAQLIAGKMCLSIDMCDDCPLLGVPDCREPEDVIAWLNEPAEAPNEGA